MRLLRLLLGRLILLPLRLRYVNEQPRGRRPSVMLGAPHTSYMDFVILTAIVFISGYRVRVLIADKFFTGLSGRGLRGIGAIPVDRGRNTGLVETLIDLVRTSREPFFLGIAPDGSRSAKPFWRSGFYRIARETGLPVTLAYIDTRTRTVGFGPTFELTGDVGADMDRIRAFYDGKVGWRPGGESTPRLREEDASA